MSYIYKFIYYILIFFLTFVITIIWSNYFFDNNTIMLVFSIIISLVTSFLIFKHNKKSNNKKQLTTKKQKDITNLSNYLLLCSNKENINFLKSNLSKNLKSSTNQLYLKDVLNNIYIPYYTKELSENDFLNIFKKYSDKHNKINIYCITCNEIVTRLINDYELKEKIQIITIEDFYQNNLQNTVYKINSTYQKKENKIKGFKNFIFLIIEPNNWKRYLLFGFILLWYSFINRYKIYFIISASIFWILTIICLSRKLIKNNK